MNAVYVFCCVSLPLLLLSWYLAFNILLEHISSLTTEFHRNRANENSQQIIKYQREFCVCVGWMCFMLARLCGFVSPISISFPSAAPVMQLIIKMEATRVSAVPLPTTVIYWAHCTKWDSTVPMPFVSVCVPRCTWGLFVCMYSMSGLMYVIIAGLLQPTRLSWNRKHTGTHTHKQQISKITSDTQTHFIPPGNSKVDTADMLCRRKTNID